MATRPITVNAPCPICGFPATAATLGDSREIACNQKCGVYRVTGTALQLLENDPLDLPQIAVISGWIRDNPGVLIDSSILDRLRVLQPPPVGEKAEKILRYLVKAHRLPGEQFEVEAIDPVLHSAAWAINEDELAFLLLEYLVEEKAFLKILYSNHESRSYRVRVTPKGWAYLDSLRFTSKGSRIGFIAIWFRDSMSPVREALERAITQAGYEPKVMLTHEHANRIDDEIAALIRQSQFLVADFTGNRGGVYFEAGYGHGLGIPVICTCRKSMLERGRLHFDINHFPFIPWERDGCEALAEAVQRRIEHVVGRGPAAQA